MTATTDPLEVFAANLGRVRTARGWSQERMALEAGLHLSHVSKIERREREPGVRAIARLCQGLGISAGELFKGTDGR